MTALGQMVPTLGASAPAVAQKGETLLGGGKVFVPKDVPGYAVPARAMVALAEQKAAELAEFETAAGKEEDGKEDNPQTDKPPPPMIHNPTGGIERNDLEGSGWYGASRTHGSHQGTDVLVNPGEPVTSLIDGVFEKRKYAYKPEEYPERTHLKSVHVRGTGLYEGMMIKVLYLDDQGPMLDDVVKAGVTVLGRALDVGKAQKKPNMKPHIHIEIEWKGKRIDPALVLPNWRSEKPK